MEVCGRAWGYHSKNYMEGGLEFFRFHCLPETSWLFHGVRCDSPYPCLIMVSRNLIMGGFREKSGGPRDRPIYISDSWVAEKSILANYSGSRLPRTNPPTGTFAASPGGGVNFGSMRFFRPKVNAYAISWILEAACSFRSSYSAVEDAVPRKAGDCMIPG